MKTTGRKKEQVHNLVLGVLIEREGEKHKRMEVTQQTPLPRCRFIAWHHLHLSHNQCLCKGAAMANGFGALWKCQEGFLPWLRHSKPEWARIHQISVVEDLGGRSQVDANIVSSHFCQTALTFQEFCRCPLTWFALVRPFLHVRKLANGKLRWVCYKKWRSKWSSAGHFLIFLLVHKSVAI